jgi:hypothetical protein
MENSNFSDQDEFEFKPLTEGLGFHQKKNTQQTPSTPIVQFKSNLPDIELNSPLPRSTKSPTNEQALKKPTASISKKVDPGPQNTVDEILKTLSDKKNLDFSKQKITNTEKTELKFKPAAWEVSASLLDAMLVTAATLLCLILLLVITRVDLFANIYNPDAQYMVYWSLVALVASVAWIYLVGHRVFLGYTPGEWVFDQRLGKPEDANTGTYALKAIFRSTLVIATGFILIPAISFAMNDDVLGKMTGLRLFKKA